MSGFNKFLETEDGDIEGLQDGTQPVFSSTLSAANLSPSLPCKTDAARVIQTELLVIGDTDGLQDALDAKLANPMTANLDAGQFDIFDLKDIKIDTAGSGTDIATLEYNGTGNVTIDLDDLSGHVDSSSIPSVNNRIAVFDGTGGELIRQSTTITENAGDLAGIVDLTVSGDVTFSSVFQNSLGVHETVIMDSSGVMGTLATEPVEGSTGVTSGGILSINGSDAHDFDITSGSGRIYNPVTLVNIDITWTQSLAVTTVFSGVLTYVGFNSSATLVYKDTEWTRSELRDTIFVGVLVHVGGGGAIIDTVNNQQLFLNNPTNALHDLSTAIGFINDGNVMSSNSLLTITKTTGTLWKFGANYENDKTDPNVVVTPVIDTNLGPGLPDQFQYRNKDGSGSAITLVNITPGEFDNGGVYPSTGNVPNNSWTVQRIFVFTSNNLKVQLGQFVYGSKEDAILAIFLEGFLIENSINENGSLIGFLAVKGNATNLSTAAQAQFIPASKFGGISGGGGGGDLSSNTVASTTNRVAVFADTTGKLIAEDSAVLLNAGNLTGINNLTASGDIDFNTVNTFALVTTSNTGNALNITCQGGTACSMQILNSTGTGNNTVAIAAASGGIRIDSATGMNVVTGGLEVGSNIVAASSTAPVVNDTIPVYSGTTGGLLKETALTIDESNNIGNISNITASGIMDFDTCLTFDVVTTSNTVDAINIQSQGGTTASMQILAATGTANDSIHIDSTAGGIRMDSANGINIATGAFTVGFNPVIASTTEPVVNNTIPVYSGTGGELVKETGVVIDSSNNMDIQGGQLTTAQNILIDASDANESVRYGFNAGSGAFSQALARHTAIGEETLTASNTTFNNTAIGYKSCNISNATGNVGCGSFTLEVCTSGSQNNAFGVNALSRLVDGIDNVAVGDHSQLENIDGNRCTSLGWGSLDDNRGGDDEVGVGVNALTGNDNSVGRNTAVGAFSFSGLQNGTNNIALGYNAGVRYDSTESNNIIIGNDGLVGESNAIRIGNNANHNFVEVPKELRITEVSGTDYVAWAAPNPAGGSKTWILPATNSKTDEVQVLSNLNSTCNWTAPPLSVGYLFGFRQLNTSTTVMSFGTTSELSACRSSDNSYDLMWTGILTIDTSVTGVGGISDTYDPISAEQAYDVLAVGDAPDGIATNILAVEAGTNPAAAVEISGGTYNVWRRIGWFITQDGSTAIILHSCDGLGISRGFHYNGTRTDQTVLFAGSATTWADALSGGNGSAHYTPTGAAFCEFRLAFGDSSASNDEVGLRPSGSTLTIAETPYTFSPGSPLAVGELADTQLFVRLPINRIVQYEVSDAANELYLYVIAFTFGL